MNFSLQSDGTPLTLYNTKKQSRRENEQVGIVLKQDAKSHDFTLSTLKPTHLMKTGNRFGEVAEIRNHYNELAVTLNQKKVLIVRL
jgi:hypothetical protein